MKKWMISFVIMLILTLLVEGCCMILAYNPNLSDAFEGMNRKKMSKKMESKEALEMYHRVACYHNYIVDDSSHYATIKKDLEVLEILKPMLEIKKGSSWEYLDTKHCFFDTQEQIEIIKEWLENVI